MTANATLMDVARAYVRAAIEVFIKECPEGQSRVIKGLLEWVRTSPNSFELRDHEQPYWAVDRVMDGLSALGEYAELLAALRADPVIAPQLDNLVGTGLNGSRCSAERFVNQLLWNSAVKTGPLRFADELFNAAFQKMDADLRKSEFDFVLVAPIWQMKIDSLPVQFSPSLEIDALTDEEIVRCLRASYFPQALEGFAHVDSPLVGMRFRFRLPKRVGEISSSPGQGNDAIGVYQHGLDELRKVLHVLRLFKAGRVSIPGAVCFSLDWPIANSTSWGGLDATASYVNAYEIKSEEVQPLRELWLDVEKAQSKKEFVAGAIRRFGYAGERQRAEDKLVDLMIAAESFFLGGDRGTKSYRMAMRFAFFAKAPGYSRGDLFRQMQRAYSVRNSIVHGDNVKKRYQTKNGEVALEDFVALTEDLLRGAFKVGISMVAHDDPNFGQWEDLILR